MKIRITGEVFQRQRFGGVSRYCVELARELNRIEGIHSSVDACVHINDYLWRSRHDVNNRGWFLNSSSRNAKRFCRVAQGLNSRLARGNKQELIHASYYEHKGFRANALANVSTFYDMIHERFRPAPSFFEQKKLCYQRSDRCIAISHATKSDMVHFMDADPDKIDVVYLASRLKPSYAIKPPIKEFLLWVGPRSWYKNFLTFAKGYVQSTAGRDGTMILCAGGSPISAHERESWLQLGLRPDRVVHIRPSDDMLAALYSQAIALVYASRYEGFGIPPLEAMMCNCPVLASNAGSIPEVVGDAALLFDPDDAESIATQLDTLLFSSTLAKELRERGRRQATKFSWERCAKETYASYLRALNENGRSFTTEPVPPETSHEAR